MELYKQINKAGYEQVVFYRDSDSGLKAIISVHSTVLGPALGGARMWAYDSEEDAIEDVLRLSKGMTYKAAVAGLNLGGGKAVIIGDSKKDKNEKLLRAFGKFVDSLQGRYITAEDVGTCQEDMNIISQETKYVTGIAPERGGSGDPSPFTALGVYQGIKAAVEKVYGTTDLKGKVVAVQGVGNVGYYLCQYLASEGARLIVSDINTGALERAQEKFEVEVVSPQEIFGVDCDIFAPCALGAVVNDATLPEFKCKIIAGGANNVLAEPRHGDLLHKSGILYMPDYVINAGGLINVAQQLYGYDQEIVRNKVLKIYDNCVNVLKLAEKENIATYLAADRVAEQRLAAAKTEVSKVG
ncbi:Glu/Leu/Phe/Val family dehydrogenase [Zhaonella formicivorans]|uniref:Glu/Leu/Phe/Val family dehydrogenase n=1 Tax=Zhaonella formicivorans TaxID=2528593 RepID=UPI0010D81066|nr:Glu/Leu/Phe/Val dehydrogenase [Zhaonella formicivorans]